MEKTITIAICDDEKAIRDEISECIRDIVSDATIKCYLMRHYKDYELFEAALRQEIELNVAEARAYERNKEEAQNAPTPITNYALFRDGEYITNEQMNDKKFLKLVGKW